MRKVLLLLIVFLASLIAVHAESTTWSAPTKIKTYIPADNKRTTMMKHAFAEWSRKTNDKVVFVYTKNPKIAQVTVYFVDTIPNADREIGLTKTYYIKGTGQNVKADIYIAERPTNGKQLGNDSIYTCMIHEIGHALGILEHSKNPLSIMYPYEDDRQEILKSDLKTLSNIYGW